MTSDLRNDSRESEHRDAKCFNKRDKCTVKLLRQIATLIVSKGIIPKSTQISLCKKSYSYFISCMDAVCAVYNRSRFSKI
mgnify:CR=1 FL=1